MIAAIRVLSFAALAFVLAGCSALEPYPRAVTDIGESADYPLEAAGFRRSWIAEISAEIPDVEINYRLCQFDSAPYTEIVSNIRMTRANGPADSAKSRFDAAKKTIEQSRFGVEQLENRSLVLKKNGRNYFALKAAYSTRGYSFCIFSDLIVGEPIPLYVELIVWRHEDRLITLDSTAPLGNRDIASAKNLELLDAVNWTALPF